MHRTSLWLLPEWLEFTLLWWSNGLGAALFGLLLGLAWGAFKREALPNARALVLTVILCQTALLFMTAWMQRLVAAQLSDAKWSGKMLRQTSGFSCAPASAANVAGLLGLHYSEQEMARFMSTRAAGTSPAFIIRGLRQAGIEGRKFADPAVNLDALPLPAILIVDHPAAGPESHAVAAVKYDAEKKALEIWNPLTGSELMTRTELKRIWSGHGIACQKKSKS
jgi:predicted double-glycine peptidase